MSIETYLAVLHDDAMEHTGESVVCPLQRDGQPKPVIDHDGVLYHLLGSQRKDGAFDYRRARP